MDAETAATPTPAADTTSVPDNPSPSVVDASGDPSATSSDAAAAPVTPPVEAAPKKDPFHRAARALQEKERQLRESQKEIQSQRERIAKAERIEKAVAAGDTTAILDTLGLSMENLVDLIAKNGQDPDPAQLAEARFKELMAEQKRSAEESERQQAEAANAQLVEQYSTAVAKIASGLHGGLPRTPEIERVEREIGAYAVQVALDHYNSTGAPLSHEAAVDLVDKKIEAEVIGPWKAREAARQAKKNPQQNRVSTGKVQATGLNVNSVSGVAAVVDGDDASLSEDQAFRRLLKQRGFLDA